MRNIADIQQAERTPCVYRFDIANLCKICLLTINFEEIYRETECFYAGKGLTDAEIFLRYPVCWHRTSGFCAAQNEPEIKIFSETGDKSSQKKLDNSLRLIDRSGKFAYPSGCAVNVGDHPVAVFSKMVAKSLSLSKKVTSLE